MKGAAFQPTGRTENEDTMKIGFVLHKEGARFSHGRFRVTTVTRLQPVARFDCTISKTGTGPGPAKPPRGNSRQGCRWCRVARADRDSQVSALGAGLPSGGLSGASTG